MSDVANQALERARKLREGGTAAAPKKAAAKKKGAAKKKDGKATRVRRDVPWGKIVQMHEAGKTSSEISDALGFTNKESDWPYSYTLGLMKRLRAGVEANGKTYKIKKRG